MKRTIIVALAIASLCNTMSLLAEDAAPWRELVEKSTTATEIAEKLRSDAVVWPQITSAYRAKSVSAAEEKETLLNIETLKIFIKILGEEYVKTLKTQEYLTEIINDLTLISEKINTAGGFSNIVVGTICDLVVMRQLAQWAIAHPNDLAFCRKIFDKLPQAEKNGTFMDIVWKTQKDDKEIADKVITFDAVRNIVRCNALGAIIVEKIAPEDLLRGRKSFLLLDNPSAAHIAMNYTQANAYRIFYLPMLFLYLEKGGTVEELATLNSDDFEKKMGSEAMRIVYYPAGIDVIHFTNMRNFINGLSDERNANFIKIMFN